jgi:hypothetical protein
MATASCGPGQKRLELKQRGQEESDFAGKVLTMMESDSLAGVDSVKLLQYVYQMTALDNQLYRLQDALIKGYFNACNEKCEKGQCSPGDVANAAMAFALNRDYDSAARLCQRIGTDKKAGLEVGEIIRLTLAAGNTDSVSVLVGSREKGEIKTHLGLAYCAVLTVNRGMTPREWVAILDEEKARSGAYSLDLQYAHAFALVLVGDITGGFRRMPDYIPLVKFFPPPSFSERVKIGDSIFVEKIYPPLALYIRKEIDRCLLMNLLGRDYGPEKKNDVAALKALAIVKGILNSHDTLPLSNYADSASDTPQAELVHSARLALSPDPAWTKNLASLRYPVSRATFLEYIVDNAVDKHDPKLIRAVFSEADSARARTIWEERALLSEAMLEVAGPAEAFPRMSNFGVSDLSVRNNSPEWLAIYARAGLEQGSQLSLVTQLVFNLSQHYPYTIGLYEIMQSYNHLCKYY